MGRFIAYNYTLSKVRIVHTSGTCKTWNLKCNNDNLNEKHTNAEKINIINGKAV